MATVSQNPEPLNNLVQLLVASRIIFGQERVYARVVALVVGEIMVFARHTVTQLLMTLGLNEQDWSAGTACLVQVAGPSIRCGVLIAPPCGDHTFFNPFGLQYRATGPKKSPF